MWPTPLCQQCLLLALHRVEPGWVSISPPDSQASPYPFHCSHRAPGGAADCLCLSGGTEGSWARRTAHTLVHRSRARSPAGPCLWWGGVGWVESLRLSCLRGCGSWGGRGPSPIAGSSPFPFWLSHCLLGERGGGSCLGGGPQAGGVRRGQVHGTADLRGSSVRRGCITCTLRGRSTETSR